MIMERIQGKRIRSRVMQIAFESQLRIRIFHRYERAYEMTESALQAEMCLDNRGQEVGCYCGKCIYQSRKGGPGVDAASLQHGHLPCFGAVRTKRKQKQNDKRTSSRNGRYMVQ